jgi:hypothetical protein
MSRAFVKEAENEPAELTDRPISPHKSGQILISPRVLMAVRDAVTVEPVGEFELKAFASLSPPTMFLPSRSQVEPCKRE